jgi:5-methylthioadenosine/S-adenosylhomocysteine deaminase
VSRISLVGGTVATLSDGEPGVAATNVVIEDGLIVDLESTRPGGEVIDCAGKLILPGFVNAHAHATEVLYRGLSGGLDHVDWVLRKHALQGALDEQGAEVGASLACLEILRSGAVAFLDPEVEPRHFAGVARAAAASGMRAGLSVAIEAHHGYGTHHGHDSPGGEGFADHGGPGEHADHGGTGGHLGHGGHGDHGDHGDHGGHATTEIELPPTSGRVSTWLGPRSMSALTADLGAAVARRTQATGARITFHCAEDDRDVAAVRAESGLTPARWSEQLGLLLDRSVLAHGVYLEPDDLVAIAGAGASLAHCPVSNAKTGHGIAPLAAMEAAGINVAVGTDGAMSNDTYDLLLELRMVGLIHRAAARNPAATTAVQLLRMATRNGMRALGLPGGTIEPGAPADLVIVDLRHVGSWPTHDPLDSLAFSSSHEVVDSVLVGGEVLLAAGRPTQVDERRLLADAEAVAAEVARSVGLETWVGPPA